MGDYDVIVVGSGAAGLTLALRLAPHARVAVLSKGPLSAGSTNYAQGGIATVMEATDSIQSHIDDTLVAGAGLCKPDAVRFVVERGREAIDELIEAGVSFSKDATISDDGDTYGLHLTREGGHSHRRIIHAADATGHAVQSGLNDKVLAEPNIDLFTNHVAIDIITNRHLENGGGYSDKAHGAYVLDTETGKIQAMTAKSTIIATGGASRVYLYCSSPDGTDRKSVV